MKPIVLAAILLSVPMLGCIGGDSSPEYDRVSWVAGGASKSFDLEPGDEISVTVHNATAEVTLEVTGPSGTLLEAGPTLDRIEEHVTVEDEGEHWVLLDVSGEARLHLVVQ